jgi:hypothetical protein
LQNKLKSLENVFVGKIEQPTGKALTNLLLSEGSDLRTRLAELVRQEKVLQQQHEGREGQQFQEGLQFAREIHSLGEENQGLEERIGRLMRRERELLEEIAKARRRP